MAASLFKGDLVALFSKFSAMEILKNKVFIDDYHKYRRLEFSKFLWFRSLFLFLRFKSFSLEAKAELIKTKSRLFCGFFFK